MFTIEGKFVHSIDQDWSWVIITFIAFFSFCSSYIVSTITWKSLFPFCQSWGILPFIGSLSQKATSLDALLCVVITIMLMVISSTFFSLSLKAYFFILICFPHYLLDFNLPKAIDGQMTWPIVIVASQGIIANILNHSMPFPFSKYSIWFIG